MYRPVRVAPPAEMPITVDDAKGFLRVDSDDEDQLITSLIGAATDHLDGRTGILGRCLVTQTWRYRWEAFDRVHDLDMPGAVSAVVRFTDRDGVVQTVAAEHVSLVETASGARIVLADAVRGFEWFGDFEADVTFGTAAEDVAPAIRQAIRILVAHWYAHREVAAQGNVTEVPLSVSAIVAPYRWMSA